MKYAINTCKLAKCGRTFLAVDFLQWRVAGYCCEKHYQRDHPKTKECINGKTIDLFNQEE